PPQIIPPMSYSTLNGSRPVMVTRTSLHCQTCCQGRKRGSGGSLSSAVYATDVLSTDSAATQARNSFFIYLILPGSHASPPCPVICAWAHNVWWFWDCNKDFTKMQAIADQPVCASALAPQLELILLQLRDRSLLPRHLYHSSTDGGPIPMARRR